MLSHDAYGGLEHRASSINLHQPQCLATRKAYEGLVELLSHELFHAWNGKRIAPPALLDFAVVLGLDVGAHYAHLLVHGALHAQGWDHETSEADAEAMEAREVAILASLGEKNPYA